MPQENRKRGRRGDKKRKVEEAAVADDSVAHKRQKHGDGQWQDRAQADDYIALENTAEDGEEQEGGEQGYAGPGDRPFYGLLDEEEQEYFRKAAEVLDIDDFPDAAERNDFVESVFREADGKELKLANSQSCSRLFEKLLHLATPKQLKAMFEKFRENFVPLVQHRFASHCCETLFTCAAPVVTEELTSSSILTTKDKEDDGMANYFLIVVEELKEHLGWLLTNKFASHPLRVLFLVLSGQPISQQAGKSGLHSKRKEQKEVSKPETQLNAALAEERTVPSSFKDALESLIATAVAGLDTDQLRSLSAHPLGNPTLQLLLRLELTQFGKQRAKDESSIIRVLIPEETLSADSPSSSFVVGLMYDQVGSRLLETIIEHAPAKTFKSIYRGIIFPKFESLVKNDTATYVVSRALLRLGRDELQEAIAALAPLIPFLVERNRLALIRTLVDHAVYRQANTEPLAKYLSMTYASPSGFNVIRFLNPLSVRDTTSDLPPAEQDEGNQPKSSQSTNLKLHASLLAQSLLNAPPPLSPLFLDPLTSLAPTHLLKLAQDTQAAHTLVTALTSPQSPIIARRKLISALYGHIASLATQPASSHVIDALWRGTRGLAFMRERVAEELAEAEYPLLRESFYGKRVWRNWRMDLYKRRRREWIAISKSADDEYSNNDSSNSNSATTTIISSANATTFTTTSASPAKTSKQSNGKTHFVDFPDTPAVTNNKASTSFATKNGKAPVAATATAAAAAAQSGNVTVTPAAAAAAAAAASSSSSSSSRVPNERAKKHMTALEKARERHAQQKARRERELFEQQQRQQGSAAAAAAAAASAAAAGGGS